MKLKTTVFWAALAVGLGVAGTAAAHPHVWVDTQVTALLEDGKVTAIREDWSFDEDFSASVLEDVRKAKGPAIDHVSPFSPGEIDKIKRNAFGNLRNYDYFTHVWANGQPIKVKPEVTEFAAKLEGEKLRYVFTVVLAEPVDPHGRTLRIGIWDDSYYVDVGPTPKNGAAIAGAGAEACRARISEDKAHPIYFGSIFPKTADITC